MVRALFMLGLVLVLLSTGHGAFAEKRVGLVVGNSNYALAPLSNPTNDADDLTAALKRLQFDVTEKKDLSVHDFDRALNAFIPTAQNADVALFFFSGHGVQIDKRGYLAPTDIQAESEKQRPAGACGHPGGGLAGRERCEGQRDHPRCLP
jgi:hypothetical protein